MKYFHEKLNFPLVPFDDTNFVIKLFTNRETIEPQNIQIMKTNESETHSADESVNRYTFAL